jgi:hypothetical protein
MPTKTATSTARVWLSFHLVGPQLILSVLGSFLGNEVVFPVCTRICTPIVTPEAEAVVYFRRDSALRVVTGRVTTASDAILRRPPSGRVGVGAMCLCRRRFVCPSGARV